MTREERIQNSRTSMFKIVFPGETNHHDTLFGGAAMSMMDEVAFVAATRFCRQKLVTVSSDKIDFTKPIPAGTFVESIGQISHVGRTSIKVRVEVFVEEMHADRRELAITGEFTLVAIDEHRKPTPITL